MPDKLPADDAPDPDGWSRFEGAVDALFRSPPKHKTKPQAESSPPAKGRPKTA
jgi:hypothetical protein